MGVVRVDARRVRGIAIERKMHMEELRIAVRKERPVARPPRESRRREPAPDANTPQANDNAPPTNDSTPQAPGDGAGSQ